MNNMSLKFRVLKAIIALPVPVCVIIPSLLLYFSNWQPSGFVLWRFIIGLICLLAGILLAVSTVRLFPTLGNGTPAPWDPTTKMIVTGPYAYVRNPMITGCPHTHQRSLDAWLMGCRHLGRGIYDHQHDLLPVVGRARPAQAIRQRI